MTKLIEKDLVYKIVGCAMAVHNEIEWERLVLDTAR